MRMLRRDENGFMVSECKKHFVLCYRTYSFERLV